MRASNNNICYGLHSQFKMNGWMILTFASVYTSFFVLSLLSQAHTHSHRAIHLYLPHMSNSRSTWDKTALPCERAVHIYNMRLVIPLCFPMCALNVWLNLKGININPQLIKENCVCVLFHSNHLNWMLIEKFIEREKIKVHLIYM